RGGREGSEAFAGVDRTKNAIERHRRDRDDGDAERDADPVPADPLVAEHRPPMQRIEHLALTIPWSPLHRSTRHAIFRTPHIVVATSDVQSRRCDGPSSGRFEPMTGND